SYLNISKSIEGGDSRSTSRKLALGESSQDRELLFLKSHQLDPLLISNLVQLCMQRDDFQFGLRIDLIIVLDVDPVMRRLSILAHHDDRGLERRQARQHEVQENVGIRIERVSSCGIPDHPECDRG